MDETKYFYDEIAQKSFDDWFDNDELLPILRVFAEGLPKAPRILDLGCGTGGESRRLASLGARVTGVDFSEKSLELARAHVPGVDFVLADLRHIYFNEGSFDGILDAATLFHFSETDQENILKRLSVLLSPGGRFLSFYPEGDFEGLQEITVAGRTFRRYARQLHPAAWIAQVTGKGFLFVKYHECSVGSFRCMEFRKGRGIQYIDKNHRPI
ncbi:MAG: class I SAM-dependent methyltransferase [Spirochaetales bacterium]|nr:class I SAM-dependent methyltransferase [Spirochaetales bacterium]